jgi:hypothetical protein
MLKTNLASKSAQLTVSMRVIACSISNPMSVLIAVRVSQFAQLKLFIMKMMCHRSGSNTVKLTLSFLLRLDPQEEQPNLAQLVRITK